MAPNQLVFGNGSNEVIQLLIAAFLGPGEEVITSQPTFLVYQKAVQAQGGVNRVVPLVDMHHDLDAIAGQITKKTRLIFLDNPNNPCGTVFSNEAFAAFLDKVPDQVIVALDEAYVDFVEPGLRIDARDYLKHRVPVVALRTFSKAYGLAGLRVGYGLMHADIADYLHRVRQPFNVNLPAQAGALAALGDDEHYEKTIAFTREGIAWLSSEVEKLGCRPFPTQTNFFLIDVKADGKKLYEALLHQGVIVRPMNAYGYPTYIRITVGLPAENQALHQGPDHGAWRGGPCLTPKPSSPSTAPRAPEKARSAGGWPRSSILPIWTPAPCTGRWASPWNGSPLIWPTRPALKKCLADIELTLTPNGDDDVRVLLNGEDVSQAIRTPEMGLVASRVSANPLVREKLTGLQRQLGEKGGIVAEGRDMGTVVFPKAPCKFFLNASPEERARRRQAQLAEKGQTVDYQELLDQISKRDYDDSRRELAPLKPAA